MNKIDPNRDKFHKMLMEIAGPQDIETARQVRKTFKIPVSQDAEAMLDSYSVFVRHGQGGRNKYLRNVAAALAEDPLTPLSRQAEILSEAYKRSVRDWRMLMRPREIISAYQKAMNIEKDYLNK